MCAEGPSSVRCVCGLVKAGRPQTLSPHYVPIPGGVPPSLPSGLPLRGRLMVSGLFCFCSHKFGKKVTYFNYLSELRVHLQCDQLAIPAEVVR